MELTRLKQIASTLKGDRVPCNHVDQIRDVTPSGEGCRPCLEVGDRWVHLRLCLTCGEVGCCDDSKNRHARRHAREQGHPLIISFEPGEDWIWCYEDETLLVRRAP